MIGKKKKQTRSHVGETVVAKPRLSKAASVAGPRPSVIVVERLNSKTGAKDYLAFDESYNLLASEHQLDRITRKVQRLSRHFEWDYTVTKVDSRWRPPVDAAPSNTTTKTVRPRGTAADPISLRVIADLDMFRIVEMPLVTWLRLPSCPGRADFETFGPATYWQWSAFAQCPVPAILRQVSAASYDDTIYKVTGNLRSHLWAAKGLPEPESLIVMEYRVTDEAQALRVFESLSPVTSPWLVEGQLEDCLQSIGIVTSPAVSPGTELVNALALALAGADFLGDDLSYTPRLSLEAAVSVFATELMLLSSVGPEVFGLPAGVLAAALITLGDSPGDLKYFAELARGRSLPAQDAALKELQRESVRIEGGRQPAGVDTLIELCASALTAIKAWRQRAGLSTDIVKAKNVVPAEGRNVILLQEAVDGLRRRKKLGLYSGA